MCVTVRDKMITRWSLISMIEVFPNEDLAKKWFVNWNIGSLCVPFNWLLQKDVTEFLWTNQCLWNENETAVDSSLMSFLSTIEGMQMFAFYYHFVTKWQILYLFTLQQSSLLIEDLMMRVLIVSPRRHLPFSIYLHGHSFLPRTGSTELMKRRIVHWQSK